MCLVYLSLALIFFSVEPVTWLVKRAGEARSNELFEAKVRVCATASVSKLIL